MFTTTIAGRTYHVHQTEQPGPTLYLGTRDRSAHEIELIAKEASKGCNFTLVAFEASPWNDAFSPWKSTPVDASGPFGGQAPQTLSWLINQLVPQVDDEFGTSERYLCGFSMAGLFSLWALGQTDAFGGCASVSGSLWFPKFEQYALHMDLPENGVVYLNYGEREKNVRNLNLKRISAATKALADRLGTDPAIERCKLVVSPGGHFSDPVDRMASAIRWLVDGDREADL